MLLIKSVPCSVPTDTLEISVLQWLIQMFLHSVVNIAFI